MSKTSTPAGRTGRILLSGLGAAAILAAGATSAWALAHSRVTAIHVTATSYKFTGLPATVPAGQVKLEVVNRAADDEHEAQLLKLADGKTLADLKAAISGGALQGQPPSWVQPVGGLDEEDPGKTESWTGTLAPGYYVLGCFLPDDSGQKVHAQDGMIASFRVTGSLSDKTHNVVGGKSVRFSDSAFRLPLLSAGTHELVLRNSSNQPQDLIIARLQPGKTAAALLKEMSQPSEAHPKSADLLGGASVGPHSTVTYGFTPLVAGQRYVVADTAHIQDGWVRTVTVK